MGEEQQGRPGGNQSNVEQTPTLLRDLDRDGLKPMASRLYPSLAVPAYRLLWLGMVPSLLAFHMGVVAAGYAAVTLTTSAFIVGMVGGAWGIPMALMPLAGGAAADHGSRRRIMVVSHLAVAGSALVIALLSLSQNLTWWILVLHGLVLGVTLSFLTPARIAYSIDAVESRLAANTMAAFFFSSQFIAIVGPAAAGALLGLPAVGIGWTYIVIGGLYVAAALIHSRLPENLRRSDRAVTTWARVRGGFQFVRSNPPLPRLLGLTALIAVGGLSYVYVLPIFTDQTLQAGPNELGALVAASGVGGLLGALASSSLSEAPHLWHAQRLAVFGLGVGLLAFGTANSLWAAMAWVGLIGLCTSVGFIANSTLLMTHTEGERYRGRMASLYQVTIALGPIGAILVGLLADGVGPNLAVSLVGAAVVLVAALSTRKPMSEYSLDAHGDLR